MNGITCERGSSSRMERLLGSLPAAGKGTLTEVQEGQGDTISLLWQLERVRGRIERNKREPNTLKEKSPRSSLSCWSKPWLNYLFMEVRQWLQEARSLGDGFALCKSYLLGSCWCLSVLFHCFSYVHMRSRWFSCWWTPTIAKEKSLTSVGALVGANLRGSPGHFSVGVPRQMLASLQCWKIAVCSGPQGITSLTSAWATCPSAPKSPGRHGLLPSTLQRGCGPDLLADLPLLPPARAARCRVLPLRWQRQELCAWLCLQIWPLAAWFPVLLTAGEIMQNVQKDAVVCNE